MCKGVSSNRLQKEHSGDGFYSKHKVSYSETKRCLSVIKHLLLFNLKLCLESELHRWCFPGSFLKFSKH